jgi:hypothetical protein
MKKVSVIALLCIFLLSGCALIPKSAEEKAYVADCQTVQANFKEYIKLQDAFDSAEYNDPEFDWDTWSGGYAVSNAGQAARDAAFKSIQSKFPWISSITQSYVGGMSRKVFLKEDPDHWSTDLEWVVYAAFFQQMTKGTSFEVTVDSLKKIEDSSYDLQLDKVLASFAPTDRFKNCDDALGLKDEEAFESLASDYGLYGNSGVHLGTVSEVSIAIWGCKKFGVGFIDYGKGWQKCALKDFEVDWSDYPTSNEPTPEELEILAEREAQAERDAQAPSISGTMSNVTPGQICTSLGAMVETENYGFMTCKFVWVGRIKALMWMRS